MKRLMPEWVTMELSEDFIISHGGSAYESCYQKCAYAGIDQAVSKRGFAGGSRGAFQRSAEAGVGASGAGGGGCRAGASLRAGGSAATVCGAGAACGPRLPRRGGEVCQRAGSAASGADKRAHRSVLQGAPEVTVGVGAAFGQAGG